jgi:hypothetical protein
MSDTLRITITMQDGEVFELEKDFEESKVFLAEAEQHGFTVDGRFYDTHSILTMQVFPSEELPGFSVN